MREKDNETHSEECVSINDVRKGDDSSSEIGDNRESRILTDEDITICAVLPTTYESLKMCLSRNTSRPPMQRRYINQEAASLNKKQHQILLAITEHLGLPKGDKEAFAFMERYERADYHQRRSVKTILEVR